MLADKTLSVCCDFPKVVICNQKTGADQVDDTERPLVLQVPLPDRQKLTCPELRDLCQRRKTKSAIVQAASK